MSGTRGMHKGPQDQYSIYRDHAVGVMSSVIRASPRDRWPDNQYLSIPAYLQGFVAGWHLTICGRISWHPTRMLLSQTPQLLSQSSICGQQTDLTQTQQQSSQRWPGAQITNETLGHNQSWANTPKTKNLYQGSPVATDGLPGWTLTVCLMICQTHLNSDAVLG